MRASASHTDQMKRLKSGVRQTVEDTYQVECNGAVLIRELGSKSGFAPPCSDDAPAQLRLKT